MLWLAALAAVLALLLAVPVDVGVTAHRRERLQARVTVRWLWGRVRLPVPEGGGAKAKKPKTTEKPARPKSGRPSGARRALAVVRTPGFPRRAARLLGRLAGRVRVRRLELAVRLGLDDPADTGRLWGVIGPAAALVPVPPSARVAVTPDFTAPVFHLDAEGEARVVPLAVLGSVAAFLLAPATLRALVAAARGRP